MTQKPQKTEGEENAPDHLFHFCPLTLLIAVRVSGSDVEIFIHKVKAFHENRALNEMKILFLLVLDGLKPS